MTLYSFAPMFVPVLALGSLIEAISGLIIPIIFVLIWIVSAIANQVAKANRRAAEDDPEREAQLRERRRRMEEALGLPPGSVRGPGDDDEPQAESPHESVMPIAGGRVAVPEMQRLRMEPSPRRQPEPVRPPRPQAPRPTPPPIQQAPRRPAGTDAPVKTGEIGDTEIVDAIGLSQKSEKKRRHPVADLLRNPESVKQVIAARAVLDRPEW
ncbi:MAG: hypothetical protein AAGD32_17470 [Planctomycetota bacterium]